MSLRRLGFLKSSQVAFNIYFSTFITFAGLRYPFEDVEQKTDAELQLDLKRKNIIVCGSHSQVQAAIRLIHQKTEVQVCKKAHS